MTTSRHQVSTESGASPDRRAPVAKRLARRGISSKPLVDELYAWLGAELAERIPLPSNPFTDPANYALERQTAWRAPLIGTTSSVSLQADFEPLRNDETSQARRLDRRDARPH